MKKNILIWALIFLVGVLIGRFINPSKRLLNLQGVTLDEVFNIKYELNKLHVTIEEFMEKEKINDSVCKNDMLATKERLAGETFRRKKFSKKARERDKGGSERESQGFFLAFEMGHFLDSHPPDFLCTVFLNGGKIKSWGRK